MPPAAAPEAWPAISISISASARSRPAPEAASAPRPTEELDPIADLIEAELVREEAAPAPPAPVTPVAAPAARPAAVDQPSGAVRRAAPLRPTAPPRAPENDRFGVSPDEGLNLRPAILPAAPATARAPEPAATEPLGSDGRDRKSHRRSRARGTGAGSGARARRLDRDAGGVARARGRTRRRNRPPSAVAGRVRPSARRWCRR